MKQKTNGKIVIAILAMFAVAASVIGFTYAYFTADLQRNTQDELGLRRGGWQGAYQMQ